ncbi:MAG: helix-turn-helix domain-containing protein [Candidatus Pseudobacter hemicellulosilyticus]|uniref:Helix-turn-helix domain-containing protein n=1 Tax=Candidatus Pseudobacter hemicellulosilyticus TaxID=3121375 RepID=A0AAJ5WNP9_9BACT|nr:MAG: helix-turn-helix domain-containing protein [Pseudobacter sp.]
MSFYESLGYLVFGSRLRRLSETFLADVNKLYATHRIPFDATWFPVFYILERDKAVTIKTIADELGVSHSAVSQLVSSLQQKGLIKASTSTADRRSKVVAFTAKGQKLQDQLTPVWKALDKAMAELAREGIYSYRCLEAIGELEAGIKKESVLERMERHLPAAGQTGKRSARSKVSDSSSSTSRNGRNSRQNGNRLQHSKTNKPASPKPNSKKSPANPAKKAASSRSTVKTAKPKSSTRSK